MAAGWRRFPLRRLRRQLRLLQEPERPSPELLPAMLPSSPRQEDNFYSYSHPSNYDAPVCVPGLGKQEVLMALDQWRRLTLSREHRTFLHSTRVLRRLEYDFPSFRLPRKESIPGMMTSGRRPSLSPQRAVPQSSAQGQQRASARQGPFAVHSLQPLFRARVCGAPAHGHSR